MPKPENDNNNQDTKTDTTTIKNNDAAQDDKSEPTPCTPILQHFFSLIKSRPSSPVNNDTEDKKDCDFQINMDGVPECTQSNIKGPR